MIICPVCGGKEWSIESRKNNVVFTEDDFKRFQMGTLNVDHINPATIQLRYVDCMECGYSIYNLLRSGWFQDSIETGKKRYAIEKQCTESMNKMAGNPIKEKVGEPEELIIDDIVEKALENTSYSNLLNLLNKASEENKNI